MKKVIALTIMLVLLGSIAMAEIPDISSLTDDELFEMQLTLNREIVDRGLEKTTLLKQGTYVGGKDIPVGTYYLESSDDEKAWGTLILTPYDHVDGAWDYELNECAEADKDKTYYISLDEGDILTIPYQFKLTITTGIKFE